MEAKAKRKNPTPKQKARLLQEVDSNCPFCDVSDAGLLEFHHIDENPSHTVLENLIALCPTCHSTIGDKISHEAIVSMKKNLAKKIKMKEDKNTTTIEINGSTVNNPVMGNHNKVTITVHKQVTKKVVEKYPEGSIGKDVTMHGYAAYLAARYTEYRKFDFQAKSEPFNIKMIFGKVMKDFKVGGYYHIPQTRFLELVTYLQTRIDRTVLAKVNKSKGHLKNYSSYEEYKQETNSEPKLIEVI
jgi:HNH endonuclease